MTTHSSILAWRVPWTEEPGGLQSKRVAKSQSRLSAHARIAALQRGGGTVTESYLTLCDPMDCSPPGSSVHGILQARILEWVAMSSSRGSSQPRDQTQVSLIAGGFLAV